MKTSRLYIFLIALITSVSVQAGFISSGGDPTGVIECRNTKALDAVVVARFNPNLDGGYVATLIIPTGETSVDYFTGPCLIDEDNPSFSFRCTVVGRNGDSYWVRLFSKNNRRLQATFNKMGETVPSALKICKSL